MREFDISNTRVAPATSSDEHSGDSVPATTASGTTRAFLVSALRIIQVIPRVKPIKFFRPKTQKPSFDETFLGGGGFMGGVTSPKILHLGLTAAFTASNIAGSILLFNTQRVFTGALGGPCQRLEEVIKKCATESACDAKTNSHGDSGGGTVMQKTRSIAQPLVSLGYSVAAVAAFTFPYIIGGGLGGILHGVVTTPFKPIAWNTVVLTPTPSNDSSKNISNSSSSGSAYWRLGSPVNRARFGFLFGVARVFAVAEGLGFAAFFATHAFVGRSLGELFLLDGGNETTSTVGGCGSHSDNNSLGGCGDSSKASVGVSGEGHDRRRGHVIRKDDDYTDQIQPMVRVLSASSEMRNAFTADVNSISECGLNGGPCHAAIDPYRTSSFPQIGASLEHRASDGARVLIVGYHTRHGGSGVADDVAEGGSQALCFEIHLAALGVSAFSGAAAGVAFHLLAYPFTSALEEACAFTTHVNPTTPPEFREVLNAGRRLNGSFFGFGSVLFRGSGVKACAAQICVGSITFAVYDVAYSASAALSKALETQGVG